MLWDHRGGDDVDCSEKSADFSKEGYQFKMNRPFRISFGAGGRKRVLLEPKYTVSRVLPVKDHLR